MSKKLNQTGYDYNIQKRSLNHLFYTDDLKLVAKDDSDLECLLQIVRKFSDDTGMSFGLDKCAKATFERGTLPKRASVELDRNKVIKDVEEGEVYNYLVVDESDAIQHAAMKDKIRKECYRRVGAEVNHANCIKAKNTLATLVVTIVNV